VLRFELGIFQLSDGPILEEMIYAQAVADVCLVRDAGLGTSGGAGHASRAATFRGGYIRFGCSGSGGNHHRGCVSGARYNSASQGDGGKTGHCGKNSGCEIFRRLQDSYY
jgi:hypothetical protein